MVIAAFYRPKQNTPPVRAGYLLEKNSRFTRTAYLFFFFPAFLAVFFAFFFLAIVSTSRGWLMGRCCGAGDVPSIAFSTLIAIELIFFHIEGVACLECNAFT